MEDGALVRRDFRRRGLLVESGGMAFISRKVVSMHQLVRTSRTTSTKYLGYHQHLEGWGGINATFIFLSYGKSVETRADSRIRWAEFSSYSSRRRSPSAQIAEGLRVGVNRRSST
jgi:hypothetical protein